VRILLCRAVLKVFVTVKVYDDNMSMSRQYVQY
jgi:hypothetical protein